MRTHHAMLAQMIHAVGEDNFPIVASRAVCEFANFEMALVAIHRSRMRPMPLFDNFDVAGGRLGIDNYLSYTHRLNPFLENTNGFGAFRARDFKIAPRRIQSEVQPHVLISPEEELGFLTVGWPPHLEEVGLYFPAIGGVVELSIYREQARTPISLAQMKHLSDLCEPIGAAFDRHHAIASRNATPSALQTKGLSPREEQIVELLLIGCTTEAVALRLRISSQTVKSYRKLIFRKLGICSLAELFALCWGGSGDRTQTIAKKAC